MKSQWKQADADACVARYGEQGISPALALRVYTSRLIGGDPTLVLHGGGNTSVKDEARDALGRPVRALCVKGSGWDLATIEPPGFPAVRLEPLLELRGVAALSDEGMVNALRSNLLDAAAPNPSVEALLHAFLPHTFVDHTHADAILALVDQPDPVHVCREVFGDRLAVLPFVFPGFPLAGIAAQAYEADPGVEGIVLINHGLFTFGESAQESYERMIHYVDLAEQALARGRGSKRIFAAAPPPADPALLARVLPIVRGALARAGDGEPRRVVLHHREGETLRAFAGDPRVGDLARRGVATPDHIIRTKNTPVLLPPFAGDEAAYGEACRAAVGVYVDDYRRYFEAGALMSETEKTMLDPAPRIALVPGVGLLAAGRTEQEACIAADIYEHTVSIIEAAEGYGVYTPLGEDELFDMEYWSLEQAKLGKGAEPPLARQVALITGAGSGIGEAVARLFAAQGAQLVLLDRAAEGLEAVAGAVRGGAVGVLPLVVDVTDAAAVAEAMAHAVRRFGGLDLVVSNAGAVWQAPIAECRDDDLRASFELNFFSHQTVAREAVRVFQRQGTGGQLLFNASKAAFNPGPGMGPYALPKAAVVALMRQYALDYGELGVRSNAVNADRVPTALFGSGVLESRAKARGLSVEDYLSGNLLRRPVLPQDVAQAFLALALAAKTTGTVLPVDGGNIAAAPR